MLVDCGADMEIKNDDGDTPLMLAVRSDHTDVVNTLCKRGCNMHTHGFDNIDPIEYAVSKRNLYLSDVLMKHEQERQHLSTASTSSLEHSLSSGAGNNNAGSANLSSLSGGLNSSGGSGSKPSQSNQTQVKDILNKDDEDYKHTALKNVPSLTTMLRQQQDDYNQIEDKQQHGSCSSENQLHDSVFQSD